MITLISGTNRPNSNTAIIANHYLEVLKGKTSEKINFFSFTDFPDGVLQNEMYDSNHQSEGLTQIQDQIIIPADKFFFIFPEYNGSFPGILKLFIDALSIREYKASFKGKKAGMAGVATGRAGCLRGMDHFTDILNHVGTFTHPNRLPISLVSSLLADDKVIHEGTLTAIEQQIDDFLAF